MANHSDSAGRIDERPRTEFAKSHAGIASDEEARHRGSEEGIRPANLSNARKWSRETRRHRGRRKWGLTPLATTTVFEAMMPVSTEGQTPFSPASVSPCFTTPFLC